ncbi:MAG: type VI secretion system baseplate subunit TssE [Pseudomonadota bacterium]
MADLRETDRLQPSLLDRLTDDAPHEQTESRDGKVIDMRRLRDIVRRDIAFLLNTTDKSDVWPLEALPNVASSTLNYGMVELSGKRAVASTARELERSIRTAIETFEPRIVPSTLQVSLARDSDHQAVVSFDIRAEIWGQPLPLEIYMRTKLDIASGDIRVDQLG